MTKIKYIEIDELEYSPSVIVRFKNKERFLSAISDQWEDVSIFVLPNGAHLLMVEPEVFYECLDKR